MALREGYTTGSAAAAASAAAWKFGTTGNLVHTVNIPLPPDFDKMLEIPVERTGRLPGGKFFGEVRKDGGDDPDATHGMVIRAELSPATSAGISIEGGEGIGVVTLPGLGLPVGSAAINPMPRQQIEKSLHRAGCTGNIRVVISAPEGRERAKATLNAKLGIMGGISILGTQGIVRPFSNKAYLAALRAELEVARTLGLNTVCFCTGRRSASLMRATFPNLLPQAFLIVGDFVRASLRMARDFREIHWGCFFGKLVKLARGNANTHAHINSQDMSFLAQVAMQPSLAHLPTALAAFDQLNNKQATLKELIKLAKTAAQGFAGLPVTIHLFHPNGRELARA